MILSLSMPICNKKFARPFGKNLKLVWYTASSYITITSRCQDILLTDILST